MGHGTQHCAFLKETRSAWASGSAAVLLDYVISWSPPLHVLTCRRADHGLLHCSVTSEFLLLPVSCHLATSCSHWPHLSPLTGHRSCCLNFPPAAQMCDLTPKGDPMSSGCCGEPQGTGEGEWPHALGHLRALHGGALPPALGATRVTGMAAQRPRHLQGLSYCHPLLLHRLLGRAASGRVQSTIVGSFSAEAPFKPRAAITVCRMGTQRNPHLHTQSGPSQGNRTVVLSATLTDGLGWGSRWVSPHP